MATDNMKQYFSRLLWSLVICCLLLVFANSAHGLDTPAFDPNSGKPLQFSNTVIKWVAFGDSNTTPSLAGTTSWFKFLEMNIQGRIGNKLYRFVNLAVNATTVSEHIVNGQNEQYNIQAQLNQIDYANYAFVMLGTNDAMSGIPEATFQSYYQQFIMTLKTSGKVGRLYVLAVPPAIFPYNCIGDTCWRNTHNPQTERVVPYNTFLSGIGTYCANIGFSCRYINTSNGIQLNTGYLYAGDGVHLLNSAQNTMNNNIFYVISTEIALMPPTPAPYAKPLTNFRKISVPTPKVRYLSH